MKIAINAFNIQKGGGITHLAELLSAANPQKHLFSEIAVFSNEKTLALLPDHPWLKKISAGYLNKSLLHKLWWNFRYFSHIVKNYDILFIPGGTYFGKFKPFVNMFQNALPFETEEKNRFLFKSPLFYIKWNLLKITQSLTFKRTQGAIFPSYYLEKLIFKKVKNIGCQYFRVVPHGINPIFFNQPGTEQESLLKKKSIRLLYVSRIDFYKHQWNVIKAAEMLNKINIPVQLDLCGYVGNKKALDRMNSEMERADPDGKYIKYHGHLKYESLPELYKKTDIFVFASSCESISSILLEGMASGLAIACSKMPVAEEVLKDAGVYFNPESPEEIKNSIYQLIFDSSLRQINKQKSYQYAKKYSWDICANDTFLFLNKVAQSRKWKKNADCDKK